MAETFFEASSHTVASCKLNFYSSQQKTVELVKASQLFEDPETSGGVFCSARRFTVSATATGIKTVAVMVQPGTVESERIFEGHYVTILHRGTINSIPGEYLESDVVVGEPVVSG